MESSAHLSCCVEPTRASPEIRDLILWRWTDHQRHWFWTMTSFVGLQIFSVSPTFKKTHKTRFYSRESLFYRKSSKLCSPVASVTPMMTTSSVSREMQRYSVLYFFSCILPLLIYLTKIICRNRFSLNFLFFYFF